MTDRLLNHIVDNLINNNNYDNYIKTCIKEYIIPKYIDIKHDIIYIEYSFLVESRISTISLPRILKNIVKFFKEELKYTNVKHSSIFAISMAYLQSIGDYQGLNEYDLLYAKNRSGVIGSYLDDNDNFHCISIHDIINELVGDSWK